MLPRVAGDSKREAMLLFGEDAAGDSKREATLLFGEDGAGSVEKTTGRRPRGVQPSLLGVGISADGWRRAKVGLLGASS